MGRPDRKVGAKIFMCPKCRIKTRVVMPCCDICGTELVKVDNKPKKGEE